VLDHVVNANLTEDVINEINMFLKKVGIKNQEEDRSLHKTLFDFNRPRLRLPQTVDRRARLEVATPA
jgi:hypothetical protein